MRRRLAVGASVILLALLVGGSWALASPPGSSPDDDYHVASIWCAWGQGDSGCSVLETPEPPNPVIASVPDLAILAGFCTAFQPETSAGCVLQGPDGTTGRPVPEAFPLRSNNGGYPDGYYSAMRLLLGGSPEVSIVRMRMATFVGCLVLLAGAGLVSRASDRTRFWLFSAVASVPLGLFVFASTNPSGVAIAGAAATYPATLAALRSAQAGTRFWPASLLAAGAILAAVLSRPDAHYFSALALVCALVVGLRRGDVRIQLLAVLPSVLGLGLGVVTASSPTTSLDEGTPTSLLGNLTSVLSLYVGEFASLLGWMDTQMPSLAWASLALALGAMLGWGVGTLDVRRGAVFGLVLAVALALPLVILRASGASVGEVLQPRYLLPLVFLLVGIMGISGREPLAGPNRRQSLWLASLSSVAHAVCLHTLMRRYITGVDVKSANLNAGVEWWWDVSIPPMAVWGVGSVAFAVLTAVLAIRPSGAEAQPPARPVSGGGQPLALGQD